MSDAVMYADAQGRIQFWNSGAVRIFGFSEPKAIGRSLDIIIPENLRERHWVGFNETMRPAKVIIRLELFSLFPPHGKTDRAYPSRSRLPRFVMK
jgi:PAS domain S-box-containing protein